jgi:hypothetical protein
MTLFDLARQPARRRPAGRWPAAFRLRRAVRRGARWYALACAREDAAKSDFVIPDRLPASA